MLNKSITSIVLMMLVICGCSKDQTLKISVEEYQEKVYASWLGQIIGNIYGLPHENAYINESGPNEFPYGYPEYMLERMKELDGAFSDDDTDFEYIYLTAMEEFGTEPLYTDITSKWLYHVRERVWLANRAALAFMHYGYTPPATGYKEINPHWFQIDPQLINEIWAITAPGMIKYAADKSDWAARITNDDWGIEPTVHYGAMYSAAFFEADVNKLIDIGIEALPEGSRFIETINDMKILYNKYPNDWQKARLELHDKYYLGEPIETKTIWNANLNGAAGILALLYGQGDFQKTLDLSCAMGYDADNQAATMSGLLGAANGLESLPKDLLNPLPEENWELPFNDSYKNVTRFDMPDASLKDMAMRMAKIGENIILENGGKKITQNGVEYYIINQNAKYTAPLEIPNGPLPYMEVGKEVDYTFLASSNNNMQTWTVTAGALPNGIHFDSGKLYGTPIDSGIYPITINVEQDDKNISKEVKVIIRGKNLARSASKVLSNVEVTESAKRDSMWLSVAYSLYNNDVSTIRDGNRLGNESTFYSIGLDDYKMQDYYGYQWDAPVRIGLVNLHTGSMEENGGWFTSLNVEYMNDSGQWEQVKNFKCSPDLLPGLERFNKAHFVEYILTFDPVNTKGIRIIGEAGGVDHWLSKLTHFTSISELSVHGPLNGNL